MAIIKGKKNHATSSQQHQSGYSDRAQAQRDPQEAPAPQITWTLENIESGIVPERRQDMISTDRRRTYRRVEEKELISRAVEEAAAIRENAQQEGFAEGLRQAESMLAELREAIATMMNSREQAWEAAADDIGALAVEVAERIIKTEVTCDASLILALVKDTIQKVGRLAKTILVKVHANDVALVKQGLKDDPIPHLRAELIIMEDNTIDQGSCIVETNSGLVDASFSTQLGILKQLFGSVTQ